jgi:signal transduction histidine kinase
LLTLRDEEQRRLARDLHETVSQEMAALKMALASVGKTLPTRNKIGKQFLRAAREFADGVIQQIRTLSYLLHPLLLEEAGLGSALRWYASGFAERSGIKVQVVMKGGFGRLPKETEISVFRVVQESLTNVHRHSKSRAATIRLMRADGTVRVEVVDRGVGMALPSAATGWNSPLGVGIAGMRERVKQLGGVFEIQSEPGHGTTIRVELPVEESSQAVAEKKAELPRLKNSLPSAKTARAARAGS